MSALQPSPAAAANTFAAKETYFPLSSVNVRRTWAYQSSKFFLKAESKAFSAKRT
jgi:hypothetical protein